MLEYGRKPYITKNYREMMNTTPNRTVWNQLIEKHSEFEKPYLRGTNYDKMQFFHHIMPGFSPWRFDQPNFDFGSGEFPFDPYNPNTWSIMACTVNPSIGCYSKNETKCWKANCPFAVVGIKKKNDCSDVSVYFDHEKICVKAGPNPQADCEVIVTVLGENGEASNMSIRKCPQFCSDFEWFDEFSDDTIDRNNTANVGVIGSVNPILPDINFPLTWWVTGTGFTMASEFTNTSVNELIADNTACGTAVILVMGDCGYAATGNVECTTSCCEDAIPVSWNYDLNPETIARNDSVNIVASGGVGDYHWAVAGTGFTVANETTSGTDNVLIADNTACGSAVITVTDACESHTSGEVRCTTGQWQLLSALMDACILPGEIATIARIGGTNAFTAEKIKGKYKQHNQYNPAGDYGACSTSISSGCLTIGCGSCANHCFDVSWPTMCGVGNIACLYVDPDYEPETAMKFLLADNTSTYEWVC